MYKLAIYEFEGKRPSIGKGSYIHPDATIIGDVIIGEGCFVGAGARIRGDWGAVEIGPESNIQENCIIHVYPGEVARLGPRSHIGHGAILHTPRLGEHVLVGMGAIIMDWAEIGNECYIAAGALVTGKMIIPPNKLVLGSPAKVKGDISYSERKLMDLGTEFYIALPPRCLAGMKEIKIEDIMEE